MLIFSYTFKPSNFVPDHSSPKSLKPKKNRFLQLSRFKYKNGLKRLLKYQYLLLQGKRYILVYVGGFLQV